jgi:hypothetical protein
MIFLQIFKVEKKHVPPLRFFFYLFAEMNFDIQIIDFYGPQNTSFLVFSDFFFKLPFFCKKKNIKIHFSFDPIYVYTSVIPFWKGLQVKKLKEIQTQVFGTKFKKGDQSSMIFFSNFQS